MKIKVNKHNIEIDKQELINEKEVNVSKCYFEFSEDYTDSMVKKALFTKDNKTYEMLINNNECDYPSEILGSEGTCVLGVYAYTTENEFTRFNPTPQKFAIELGSLRLSENSQPITPSEMEQYQQALQNGLNEVNKELEEVVQIGNEVAKQGEYATQQGDYAKSVGEQLEKDKENGLFNGEKGDKGEKGDTGEKGDIGPQGEPGKDGENGKDGYTPIKGVDYFDGEDGKDYVLTEADKEEIAANLNEENNNRITENEKYISDLEATIDILTNTDTKKGELVHITDALPLPTFENKVDGNVKQETTKGNQLMDFNIKPSVMGSTATFTNDILTIATSSGYDYTGARYKSNDLIEILRNNAGKQIWFKFDNIEFNETKGAIIRLEGTGLEGQLYSQSTNKSTSFTIPETIPDNLVLRFITYNATASTECSIKITKPILYIGTETKPEYEKFTGGQASPNPEYPQEIEVLEGYNLIDIQNNNYIIKNTENTRRRPNYGNGIILDYADINHKDYRFVYVNCPLKANKYYCINAIYTNLGTLKTNVSIYLPDLEQYPINGKVFKPTSDTEWISFYISQENFVEGCKYAITDVILQEVESATATPKPYVPYGCVGIKTHGKNELDLSKIPTNTIYGIEVSYNKDTKKVRFKGTATNTFPTSIGIPIFLSKGTYTFSSVGNADTFLWFYDEHKNFISGPNNGTNKTITLEKDIVEFRVGIENLVVGQTYDLEIGYQLEKGSVATEIEDYKEQIVYLDLKGNWVGKINDDIKDYLVTDKKKYWLVKNVRKRIFTGEEDWVENTSVGTIELLINDKYARYGFDGLMCSHFHIRTGTDTSNYVGIDNNHTNIRIWGTNMTLDEFKAFAKEEYDKGTPITLVYQTKETETKHLGELPEPIKTFEGTNNIQVLANLDTNIEVTYALDVKKYFENKLAEISAQIL